MNANEKLATFLGWKKGHPELFELRWSDEWFLGTQRMTTKGKLLFEDDWDLLMEVVDKIEGMVDMTLACRFNVAIEQCFVLITENKTGRDIVDLDDTSKKKALYEACKKFVDYFERTSKTLADYCRNLLGLNGLRETYIDDVMRIFKEELEDSEDVFKKSASEMSFEQQKELFLKLREITRNYLREHAPNDSCRQFFN